MAAAGLCVLLLEPEELWDEDSGSEQAKEEKPTEGEVLDLLDGDRDRDGDRDSSELGVVVLGLC